MRQRTIREGNKRDGYTERKVDCPTITGLVLFCGFSDRQSFYDYEKKAEFTCTIKKARTFIEREYEELLHENPTAAIFALKNFDWSDKQEQTLTVNTLDDAKKALSELYND
jgi:hypothetical protein